MAWTEKYVDKNATGTGDGSSEANAWTTIGAAITGVGVGPASTPTRVNIKYGGASTGGDYALTTGSLDFSTAGAVTAPVWWRGYNTTIGDCDGNPALAVPKITFTTGSTITISATRQWFSSLWATSAATTNGTIHCSSGGTHLKFFKVRSENTGTNANSTAFSFSGTDCIFMRCYMKTSASANIVYAGGTNAAFLFCAGHGGLNGIYVAAGATLVYLCTFEGLAAAGILSDGSVVWSLGNTVNGCVDGIKSSAVPTSTFILANNILANCTGHGQNQAGATVSDLWLSVSNDQYNNGSSNATVGIVEATEWLAKTESADPFTNAAALDFSLKSTANAVGGGQPGPFTGESYTGYQSIGAVQPQVTAGGGGGLLINPGLSGGLR